MALGSRRSPSGPQIDASGVGIIDVIEMKPSLGIAHAPGVAAVLDSYPHPDPQSFVGRQVLLKTPSGRELAIRVGAVRDHVATISFFFSGLTRADVPPGSRVEFGV